MKKLWKMMLAVVVMGLAVCLCAGMTVFAEKVGGEIVEGYTWEFDTETETLTVTGEGKLPSVHSMHSNGGLWSDYVNDIQHIYIDGIEDASEMGISEVTNHGMYNLDNVKTIGGHFDNIIWKVEMATEKLTVEGEGRVTEQPWIYLCGKYAKSLNITLGDQITAFPLREQDVPSVKLGKGYSEKWFPKITNQITIDPENPYFSAYENGIYTKDFEELLYFAGREKKPKLHPNVKIIASGAFTYDPKDLVVLPWGVTTIEEDAFAIGTSNSMNVILPDTITSMQQTTSGGKDCEILFTYSESNQVVRNAIEGVTDSFDSPIYNPVDSVAEYYPNVITTGWQQSGGKTYYYSNGQKLTGWQVISPAWYYFDPDGSLVKNRWVKSGNSWYFLRNSNGMMSTNEWIDWYHVRYRTGPSGVMYANTWATVNGKWYYFQSSGAMATNQWVRGKDGKWYYLKGDGVMATNQWIYGKDKKWYYVGRDGVMLTNTKTPDGYYVNTNEVWIR